VTGARDGGGDPPVEIARRALAGREAWLVGGAVRDRVLGRSSSDLDVVVADEPGQAARALARAAGGAACFALSADHRSWRVVARGGRWQADVEPLRAETLERDLALRDFTVNAIAEPLGGGDPIDPLDGLGDLRAGRLRMAGPRAFLDDPLRVLRLVRVGLELELEAEQPTLSAARTAAPGLADVSAERVFAELRRIIACGQASTGLRLLDRIGATAVVLPELDRLHAVEQNRYHHTDVYEHTLEVLDWTVVLGAALDGADGPRAQEALAGVPPTSESRGQLAELLAEPLADEMTRGEALRWGALLHDAAKPLTRAVVTPPGVGEPGGRVTFLGHDVAGAELAREVLGRLRASERLRAHVSALARHHLRLGFLVHEPRPLPRRTVFAYLRACSPVEVDVTLLSIADRLATRGDRAPEAIAAHLELARELLPDALQWRASGPPPAPLRGDELARELGIPSGPRLGELLEALLEARYAGEIATRDDAVAYARELLGTV
jgi:putative nucleotidyltransferase with HDIG domain